MTRLLIDHPWPIDAVTDATSDGFRVLVEFEKLVVRQGLLPVPFLEQHELERSIRKLNSHTTGGGTIYRFAQQCVRRHESTAVATPIPEPTPALSATWKRALRDELVGTNHWRTPQIVIPEKRRKVWPPNADEIEIQYVSESGLVTEHRVLVHLELAKFDSHPYAVPDVDPWRHLEYRHRPSPEAKNKNPCRLPRPPLLEGVSLDQLVHRLPEARRKGWKVGGKYFYIPPDTFFPEQVGKRAWREGKAFELATIRNTIGPILLDSERRKWVWDHHPGGHPGERHWDVQLSEKPNDYLRVAHDGRPLPKKK